MQISSFSSRFPKDVPWRKFQLGITGEPIDNRGNAAVDLVKSKCEKVVSVQYKPDSFEICVDEQVVNIDRFLDFFGSLACDSIVLEATTLGFVEILVCCRALRANRIGNFAISYVEPLRYNQPRRRHLLHSRDFELSDEVHNYQGIPGNLTLLRDRRETKSVFFLGYEDSRFRRAFEELQMIESSRTSVTFGVPAFCAGWEMDAIANNIGVLREYNVRGGIHYCGATNPLAVVELLDEVKASLSDRERLLIVPLGTKPHSIGVALFASANRDVGLMYDNPIKQSRRGDNLATWHLYEIEGHLERT
jgi:hypothetical protein